MLEDNSSKVTAVKTSTKVSIAVMIGFIVAVIILCLYVTNTALKTTDEYKAQELQRTMYEQDNYTITGELYAVTPDGVEVVEDELGRLWEIPGLHVTRHDRLLLEIRNGNAVVNVWRRAWALNPEEGAATAETTP